jgi:pimeloyl-ACP methyl ester carboxylesterase
MTSAPRRTVQLRDNRFLSYLELGDPQGVPVLFTMGSPSSAIGALAYADSAERNGIRLISVDKPGYGQSTRARGRTLLGYGEDLRELADELGLERVALAGQSGGGPHALAAARVLGDRVTTLCLLCTYGPVTEPWARDGLNALMRTTNWFAVRAPRLMGVPVRAMNLMLGNPDRMERGMRRMAGKMTPRERADVLGPEMRLVSEGLADAFSGGTGAVADEFVAIGRPWGFPLEDVTTQTDLWHGTADKSCPIGMVRGMAERLPKATLHELEGLGHPFFGPELDEAMATLRDRAQGAASAEAEGSAGRS